MNIRSLLSPVQRVHSQAPDLRDHPVFTVASLRHVGRTLYVKRLTRPGDAPLTLAERAMLAVAAVPADRAVRVEGHRRINRGAFVAAFDEQALLTLVRPPRVRHSI